MVAAPASGYRQFANASAGACFYIKTQEGYFAKAKVLSITNQGMRLGVVYRPDGGRGF